MCFLAKIKTLRFLSTLSLRRATLRRAYTQRINGAFLSTLSLRRATRGAPGLGQPNSNFYPRSPCGERRPVKITDCHIITSFLSTLSLRRATRCGKCWLRLIPFLSTLSLRRATRQIYQVENQSPFLSTLSLRRATALTLQSQTRHNTISIHALLAESDSIILGQQMYNADFYPRSPCGERLLHCTH